MTTALACVQTLYAAFGRGDVPAILELLADDVQWRFVGDAAAPYTAALQGRSALAGWFGDVAKVDDIQAFEPREFLVGPDHVTVIGWERTVARATGKAFECDWVHIFSLREGKICRFLGLLDTERAAGART